MLWIAGSTPALTAVGKARAAISGSSKRFIYFLHAIFAIAINEPIGSGSHFCGLVRLGLIDSISSEKINSLLQSIILGELPPILLSISPIIFLSHICLSTGRVLSKKHDFWQNLWF